jgi:Predicted ring-cleavage extradiol dioxygenase
VTEKPSNFARRPPEFRMPDELTLGPVRLEIADLHRSITYYRNVIGLRVLEQSGSRAALGPVDEEKVLVELNEVRGAREHPYNRRLGLYHFAILLPTRADLGRFVAHLAHIDASAGQADHFVSEAFYLRDPDGLGIEVYADRPRAEWPVIDGKLEMGLDPVDMESLLASAGETKWTGAPAGTIIGHVHLHVGDLAEGEKFFHRALGLDVTASLPLALFLSAGGYHHHLGTNGWAGKGPAPREGDARLLEWTIDLPRQSDVEAAANSVRDTGYAVAADGSEYLVSDPWNTRFRLRSASR